MEAILYSTMHIPIVVARARIGTQKVQGSRREAQEPVPS